jgi:hypothetical protein
MAASIATVIIMGTSWGTCTRGIEIEDVKNQVVLCPNSTYRIYRDYVKTHGQSRNVLKLFEMSKAKVSDKS